MEKNFEQPTNQPKSALELLAEFEQREQPALGELMKFEGTNGKDVYNITAPFEIDGEEIIAGRVESQETEYDSQTCFFKEQNGIWVPVLNTPAFDIRDPFVTKMYQDPFVIKIGNEHILGGVKISGLEKYQQGLGLDYHTEFFRGEHLKDFKKFAEGPPKMKDIRVLPLSADTIAVFTRPQGEIGGRGKIGFTIVPSLDALATTDFLQAKIIEGQFIDDEWGGANELHILKDGRIGVLGHIGHMDKVGKKHYYAVTFIFDPQTETATPLRIIATRKNFPSTLAKSSDDDDIIFPGGIILDDDGSGEMYGGLNNKAAGKIKIKNVFSKN